MPQQEYTHRPHAALLFAADDVGEDGQPRVLPPIQIQVRWSTKRREIQDKQGNTIVLDASAVVGKRIKVGSNMWLGTLSDWAGTGSGSGSANLQDSELMEVKYYNETFDVKGRAKFREVGLMRLHSKPIYKK